MIVLNLYQNNKADCKKCLSCKHSVKGRSVLKATFVAEYNEKSEGRYNQLRRCIVYTHHDLKLNFGYKIVNAHSAEKRTLNYYRKSNVYLK